MPASDLPTFNLKVVLAETGLKPDTIRAWERRYGLPAPPRSAGGQRLYSPRDIAVLRWLAARRDEGLSISKAVLLWRQIETQGEDPLLTSPRRGPEGPAPLPAGASLEEARQGWIEACLAFEEAAAERIVVEAFAAFPVEAVCFSVLQDGLATIGELWYANRATVQQEHFASELAVRRLESLVSAAPPPHRRGKIMVACAADETHTFAPLLLVLLLRRSGWEVVYLGADVPQARLESAVERVRPRAVVLAAQHLHSAARLQDTGLHLRRAGVRMAYGGLIFNRLPELRMRIPGEFLGERLDRAPRQLTALLEGKPHLLPISPRASATQAALDHFRDRLGRLGDQLRSERTGSWIDPAHLQIANHFLGQGITDSLSLGDIAYLKEDLHWVNTLLANHGANHGALADYLQAYLRAARATLGAPGAPILSWLERTAAGAAGG
jgi:DNA-binding transcriptional MerR regulator